MTTPTSAVSATQDALLAALQADVDLTGIHISLGWPWTTPEATQIWIDGDVEPWLVEPLTTGLNVRHRRETFTLVVHCQQQYSSNEYASTRNAALIMANAVMTVVRGDHTIGGSVDDSECVGGAIREIKNDAGSGRGVDVQLHVNCSASLNG